MRVSLRSYILLDDTATEASRLGYAAGVTIVAVRMRLPVSLAPAGSMTQIKMGASWCWFFH